MMRAVAGLLSCAVLTACSVSTSGSPAPISTASSVSTSPVRATPTVQSTPPSTPPSTPRSTPRAAPAINACRANSDPQRVIVSLHRQHAWLCERSRTVRETPITSGASAVSYYETPIGEFQIQSRERDVTLHPLSGGEYPVRYWVTFDAPLFGFHDASWQTIPYGSGRYRTDGSHGCVHLPLSAMRFLYDWAHIGATVLISP